MKAKIPQHPDKLNLPPEHYSFRLHREQRNVQIILPIILSALVFVGMVIWICLATFKSSGDVGRWAAISTIWMVIPALIAGLIFLLILIGLIYLMARALGILPHYTGIAQDYVYKFRGYIIRGADMAASPVLVLNGWLESIRAFFGRITP